ncbi:hypothetical protein C8R46DRAFT_1072315, partial [Mycena filopes]
MRRLFSRRNKDKDAKRASSVVVVPQPPTPVRDDELPPTPVLSSGSEPASSASSNGSASLSIPTPDDADPRLLTLTRTPTKSRSWTGWLGKRSTIKRARPAATASPLDDLWVEPLAADWRPKQPAPILHAPPLPGPKSQPPPLLSVDIDSDEDASSSGSDDDESVSLLPPALSPPIQWLEILTRNSLVPPLVPSPFAHLPGAPMYPRSSNAPRSLPVRPSIQSTMHKTLLLRRLHHTDVSSLTAAQELNRSISPFASRPPPTPVAPPSSLPWFNDRALAAEMRLSPSSPGLRRWMARPCFEERFAVWVPLNGVIAVQPVQGSSLAVAELEYSAALDAMIGFGLPPVEEEDPSPAPPPPPVSTPQPQPSAAPAVVRNTPYQAVPSPLRNSALKSPVPKSPVLETPPPAVTDVSPSPPAATVPAATTSRVRFVEDDKEDAIPLGYALRVKKRREEKAKFLREEQERRAFEAERAKQEAERLKREQERKQWEEERKAWEKEKRAMEEERKQRIYAEEVAAARLRREHQRAGGSYGAGASNTGLLAASSSSASLRDERNRHSRPLHDQGGPRRQASEPAVPQHGNTPSSSPHTSMGRNSSRPASVHTLSSEDGRQPPNTASAKRSSMASLPGRTTTFDRSSTYSMWSASNPTLMPPVPPVPMYAMDMPLLPPTPPFMLQQYPRPRSQNSQNPSPGRSPSGSPSRQRLPSNSSSERVNVQPKPSSSSRRGSNSSPHRPDMSHQRRSSDDARRASLPPPKLSQHDR